jgi:hypothetical protein
MINDDSADLETEFRELNSCRPGESQGITAATQTNEIQALGLIVQ